MAWVLRNVGVYRLAAEQVLPVVPARVMPWLWQPELMKQWMPGVADVRVLGGQPHVQGCRTKVTVTAGPTIGSLGWTLVGHVDVLKPMRLERSYSTRSVRAGVRPTSTRDSEYRRTVVYELAIDGTDSTRLSCDVRTEIPGLTPYAARAGGKADQKSLVKALAALSELCRGERPPWVRRVWAVHSFAPQAL